MAKNELIDLNDKVRATALRIQGVSSLTKGHFDLYTKTMRADLWRLFLGIHTDPQLLCFYAGWTKAEFAGLLLLMDLFHGHKPAWSGPEVVASLLGAK